jgi:hypothetical protein
MKRSELPAATVEDQGELGQVGTAGNGGWARRRAIEPMLARQDHGLPGSEPGRPADSARAIGPHRRRSGRRARAADRS